MTCQLITGRRNSDRTRVLYEKLFQALDRGDRAVYLILPNRPHFSMKYIWKKCVTDAVFGIWKLLRFAVWRSVMSRAIPWMFSDRNC